MLSAETRLRRADDTAWRAVDAQAVVVSSGAQRVRILNETGTRLWELCDGRTLREILAVVREELEVDPGRLEVDARAFFQDLLSRGMLVAEDARS
jgi:hypothetical protein